jgi:hypothetical protein
MHYSGGFGVGNKSFTAGISIDAIVPSDVELKN